MPLIKIQVIAVLRFAARVLGEIVWPVARPLIKRFIENVKAHLIAKVIEFRRERMMAWADGIASHLLQQCETIRPDSDGNGVAKRAGVLMNANALEFRGLAVDQQTAVGNEFEMADAKRRRR